jgi:hypothetical protein
VAPGTNPAAAGAGVVLGGLGVAPGVEARLLRGSGGPGVRRGLGDKGPLRGGAVRRWCCGSGDGMERWGIGVLWVPIKGRAGGFGVRAQC